MEQTPAHEQHNPDLLKLIPAEAANLIEIGCSSGALAREFKQLSPECHYIGIEIDPHYAELAKRHCDESFSLDIEIADDAFWKKQSDRDCWIFGDTLEHLKDPWLILKKIRDVIPANGSIVVCIPNAQHWSLQVKLSVGDFRYQDSGLLDRTHLRWFTRQTIIEMFDQTGFKLETGFPRVFEEPRRELFIPLIERLASRAGADPKIAISDALPLQYVLRVRPR
jgi:SAM-dependent methyltransferase